MIKVGLEGARPVTAAGLRLIIAAIVAFAIVLKIGVKLARTKAFILLAASLGVFQMAAPYALAYWAEQHMEVTVLSYQTFIIPILAALLGWIFLGETVTFQVAVGGGLILAGIGGALSPAANKKRYVDARA